MKRPNAARQRWTLGLTTQPVKEIVWLNQAYLRSNERASSVEVYSHESRDAQNSVHSHAVRPKNIAIEKFPKKKSPVDSASKPSSEVGIKNSVHQSATRNPNGKANRRKAASSAERRLLGVTSRPSIAQSPAQERLNTQHARGVEELKLDHSPACTANRNTIQIGTTKTERSIAHDHVRLRIPPIGIMPTFLLSGARAVCVVVHSLGARIKRYVRIHARAMKLRCSTGRSIPWRLTQLHVNGASWTLGRTRTGKESFVQLVAARSFKKLFALIGIGLPGSLRNTRKLIVLRYLNVMGGDARYA